MADSRSDSRAAKGVPLDWEAVSGVAEIVGAIAVVVTLIYLARQIRQNTGALRSTATQAASDQAAESYRTLATDPVLAGIFIRGLERPEELSDVETAQFNSLWMHVCFNMQNWYVQTHEGFLDGSLLESWSRIMRPISVLPGFQAFWQQRRHIYTPEFGAFIDSLPVGEPDRDYRPLGIASRGGGS
jgi:hypothetical protein